jgi:hypothetical protein
VPELKQNTATRRKLASAGAKFGPSRGNRGKRLKPAVARPAHPDFDLRGITAELEKQIEIQLSKVVPKTERRVIGLEVIVDGGRIRVGKAKISPSIVLTKSAQKTPAKFDPHEAGRNAVNEMQQAEGGSWIGGELGDLHQLSPANLHKRRAEHRIVWWKDAKNQFHYPKWQFTPAGTLRRGVQAVLQIFQSQDEWRIMRYFLGPRDQLAGHTPLDLVRKGEVEKVIAHAKRDAEENTW